MVAANIIIKALGFLYRVILTRLLGTEGIGLTEMAMPIFSFFLVISTWGLSLAMSKMIAEAFSQNKAEKAQQIFYTGRRLMAFGGIVATILAILLAKPLTLQLATDSRVYYCFAMMIPAIFIIAVCSAYRAYFQGVKELSVLGIGQLIEQIVRVACGLYFAYRLLPYGLLPAVVGVAGGSVCGELAGFIFMWMAYLKKQRRSPLHYFSKKQAQESYLLPLLSFGTPVTFTRIASSIFMMLQAFLIPAALQAGGLTIAASTEAYGRFAGVAMTLLHLPGVFTVSLTVAALPAIAEAMGRQNIPLLKHRINHILQVTMITTLPGMVILFYYGRFLCTALFHSPSSAEPLLILTLGGIFIYLQATLSSILQGLGEVKAILINLLSSNVILLLGIIVLTPLSPLGIKGAAIATNMGAFSGFVFNLYSLQKCVREPLNYRFVFIQPVLCLIPAILGMLFAKPYLAVLFPATKIAACAAIGVFLGAYFCMLFLTGGLTLFKRT